MKTAHKIIALLLISPLLSIGGQQVFSSFAHRNNITTTTTLQIGDGISPGGSDGISRQVFAALRYPRSAYSDTVGAPLWEYQVSFKVYPTGSPGTFKDDTLTLKYGKDGDYIYDDKTIFTSNIGSSMTLEITSISAQYSLNGGSSYTSLSGNVASTDSNIPSDIQLRFNMETNYYPYLNPDSVGYVHYDAPSEEIRWLPVTGAEGYDVEWVFIDKEDTEYNNMTNYADPFNYKEPSRIRSSGLSYFLPLVYPQGKLYFRVRPVGRFTVGTAGNYTYVKLGSWGYERSATQTTRAEYEITTGFENSRIWQYQVNYAEEGKSKRLITYYDATLRKRQQITSVNSEDVSLVAETKYDHEGRPALEALPAPVSGFNFSYQLEFNRYNNTTSYEKEHFDKNNPEAMHNSAGAENYYSAVNPFTSDPFRDRLPRANGYPFVHTRYLSDNTGRVRSVSGVGQHHKTGSGHETKTFYGNPNATELHRMFGTNVGKASHYKKIMNLDPNGQLSIAYQDQQGRTIATALAGDSPENLVSIAPAAQSITVDLSGNNVLDSASGEIIAINRHLNVIPATNYDFYYQLDGALFNSLLKDPADENDSTLLCLDCAYELEISITDPEGDELFITVTQGTDVTSTQKFTQTYSASTVQNCVTDKQSFPALSFSATFNDIGEYLIVKKLKVILDTARIAEQVNSALLDLGISLDSLESHYLSNIDTTQCDVTCDDHCLTRVLQNNPSLQPGVHDAIIQDSVEACKASYCQAYIDSVLRGESGTGAECEGLLEAMKLQVSPGGFYYESSSGSSFWQAVIDLQNNQDLTFESGDTIPSSATYDLTIPTNWSDHIAGQVVHLHREYCHYEMCTTLVDSKVYDARMAALSGWNDALAGDYDDPTTSPTNKDPFASLTLGTSLTFKGVNYASGTAYGTILDATLNNFYNSTSLKVLVTDQHSFLYDNTPYTDENQIRAFTGIYLGLKQKLISEIKAAEGCAFYTDSNAIMQDPAKIEEAGTQNSIAAMGASFWEDCTDLCNNNAANWLYQLRRHYPDSLSSPADSTTAYNALYNYCMTNPLGCGAKNPFGLITDTIFNDPLFDTVITVFNGLGVALDSIVVPDPYVDSCTTSETYSLRVSDVWLEIFKLINDSLNISITNSRGHMNVPSATLYPAMSSKNIDYVNYAAYDFPPPLGTRDYNDAIAFTGNSTCIAYFIDESGDSIHICDSNDNSLVTFFDGPYLSDVTNPTTPVSYSYKQSGDYANFTGLYVNLYMRSGLTRKAYLWFFNDIVCSFFTQYDTIPCMVSVDTAKMLSTPNFNWGQRKTDCIAYLRTQALNQAAQQYDKLKNEVRNQIIKDLMSRCLSGGFDEDYRLTYSPKEYHYTLYYYDQAGNLAQTVPPGGVELLGSSAFTNGVYDGTTEPAHRLPSQYRYNARNQVTWQSTPDGGISRFYYNRAGQLRFSQNARQHGDRYSYTKYDGQGRIVESGESDQNVGSNAFADSSGNSAYPTYGWDLSRTFYDEMIFASANANFTSGQQNLRNRVASAVQVIGSRNGTSLPDTSDITAATHYSYDIHGNVNELVQESRIMPATGSVIKHMAYTYDLISGNVLYVNYQKGQYDEFTHWYEYDADNRLLKVRTSPDEIIWDTDAEYSYYLHGPLARMVVGRDKVQSLDYTYTIQGWLKGVNAATARYELDPGLDGLNAPGNANRYNARDAFGFQLDYYGNVADNQYDYQPIESAATHISTVAAVDMSAIAGGSNGKKYHLYNGNIRGAAYSLPQPGQEQWMPMNYYGYNYDQLNRLVQMRTKQDYASPTDNLKAFNLISTDFNDNLEKSSYTYDANGNLLNLYRKGNGSEMDSLSYGYWRNDNNKLLNNKLRHVGDKAAYASNYTSDFDWSGPFDQASSTGDIYFYDATGNLIEDKSEEIDNIRWYPHGKIEAVERENGSTKPELQFFYGPDGHRIAKIEKERPGGNLESARYWTVTHYVNDASGNPMAVYEESFQQDTATLYQSTVKIKERPLYGSSRLGLYTATDSAQHWFTAISTTTGFGNDGELSVAAVLPAGQNVLVNGSLFPIIITPGNNSPVQITALGGDIQLSGSYEVTSGTTVSSGGQVFIPEGAAVTLTSGTFFNLLGSGNLLLNSTTDNSSISTIGPLMYTLLADPPTEFNGQRKLENKTYEYTNHLGNVLMTTSDRKTRQPLTRQWYHIKAGVNDFTVNEGGRVRVTPYEEGLSGLDSTLEYEICIEVLFDPGVTVEVVYTADGGSPQILSLSNGINCFTITGVTHVASIIREVAEPGLYKGFHLNNVRVSYFGNYYLAEVEQAQDYYPFGQIMPNRNFNAGNYRYAFNGKESDDEVSGVGNQYDYGFRIYNPRIARFLSVDPLFKSFPWYTPYQFAGNKPIAYVDLDGLEEFHYGGIAYNTMSVINKIDNWFTEKHIQGTQLINMTQSVQDNTDLSLYDKGLLYIAPYWWDVAPMTSQDDSSVLLTGKHLDGSEASTFDKVMAGTFVLLPVSGQIGKKAFQYVDNVFDVSSELLEVANYAGKHAPSSKTPWNKIVEATKNGPSKFAKDVDIEKVTKEAWDKGEGVNNGKPWKVYDAGNDSVIGASAGKETQYMRVELTESTGELHASPITKQQYDKLTKKADNTKKTE